MRIIETQLYKFEELSEESQLKAIEKNNDINTEYWNWWESTYDDFILKAVEVGFKVDDIYFSHMYCQGSGAMFEYSGIDKSLFNEAIDSLKLPNWKKEILKASDYSMSAKHSGNYHHEKSVSHSSDLEFYDALNHDNIMILLSYHHEDIENYIIDKYETLCKELINSLYLEYEYHTSNEAIKDTLIANEYEFNNDGELI